MASQEGHVDVEALKARLVADIEAKLAQKEDSLWNRGQVEIKKLQQEQKEVLKAVKGLQDRQELLITENEAMRAVLSKVTANFEQVVQDVRAMLRTHPHHQQAPASEARQRRDSHHRLSPSPSEASTTASGEGKLAKGESRMEPTPAGSSSDLNTSSSSWMGEHNQASVAQTPLTMWHGSRGSAGSEAHPSAVPPPLRAADTDAQGLKLLFTPPRTSPAPAGVAPPMPASWDCNVSSPAVLSLASALPSAVATNTPSSPPSGLKQLHLAEFIDECLGDQQTSASRQLMNATPPLPSGKAGSSASASAAAGKKYRFINVAVAKEQGFTTLGMEVNQVDDALLVTHVDEHGLVGRFNARQDPYADGRVLAGDCIIDVNNVRKDPDRMLQECKYAQVLSLTLRRPASTDKAGKRQDDEKKGSSSPVTKLRPDAEVFVPSARKEPLAQPSAQIAFAPPGLELDFDKPGAVASQIEKQSDSTSNLTAAKAEDENEVVKRLFH
eukprot:TRINITY_DN38025_c0_g1_i1.p1 TRINITY_DN38025_c0_g1~~TRINITY_DN38025_c0_g1_i1.p1  ORF type:complete len:497 (-),score=116.82 TRINITY_DN38025_c0_g1_i1:189-1679(-)